MEAISKTSVSKVLVCLARSPRIAAVAREANAIARVLSAEVVFVHAGDDEPAARATLEGALRDAHPDVQAATLLIRPGKPDRVICDAADEVGADLIIAGALEKEGLIQGILGSVARRIARNAQCSVLLLTELDDRPEPFQCIVASVQYDAASAQMIEFALQLVRNNHSRSLHVVHEYDILGLSMAALEASGDTQDSEQALMLKATEEIRLGSFLEQFDLQGVPLETACVEGREGQESVEYARRHNADLLLLPVPSRPLTIWDRFFNHPTEFILQKLPCALMLFRCRQNATGHRPGGSQA